MGYAPDEALSNDDMIAEKYVGIRPAPGYPPARNTSSRPTCSACWTARIGMMLTDSYAMYPASSVLEDYARAQRSIEDLRRTLAPNLG